MCVLGICLIGAACIKGMKRAMTPACSDECWRQSSTTRMGMRWSALRRSNVEKVVASLRGMKAEFMRGREYLFLTVVLFNSHEWMQGQWVPSFLPTKKNPAADGEDDGRIIPAASKSWMSFSMSCSETDRLKSQLLGSGTPGKRSIAQLVEVRIPAVDWKFQDCDRSLAP